MPKVLETDELLKLAASMKFREDRVEPVAELLFQIESQVEQLSKLVADQLDIKWISCDRGDGGITVEFDQKYTFQECPDDIRMYDPHGKWGKGWSIED